MSRPMLRAASLCFLIGLAACGDDDPAPGEPGADASAELDAGWWVSRDAPPPARMPGQPSQPPLLGDAGVAPTPIPASDEYDPVLADEDAGAARPRGCLWLEPGDELAFDAELTARQTWRRIDADDGCPATTLSAWTVPFEVYALCASARARTVEIIMRGADMWGGAEGEALLDPLLVVYAERARIERAPFSCLAANDDGAFSAGTSNSARIEALELDAGERAVIVATSHQAAEQRGTGMFSLSVRASAR